MPTKLFTIRSRGEGYSADVLLHEDGSRSFVGDMDVDVDGSPFWHNDPTGAPTTSLRLKGKSIDASRVAGIVLPPECIREPKEVVLGCKCSAIYRGVELFGVVFDSGPHSKLGEGSYAMAKGLGLPALHNGNGGTEKPEVTYRYWPGVAAVVDGITYDLQPS